MLNWLKNTYNKIFLGFLFSVVVTFLYVRPLNSPSHPFIGGDGLGYYSYLPATFIYHDTNYEFKWFNKVHNANYAYSAFENPEQNILVNFGAKKINKFYQGLSYIWLPFFAMAHFTAKLFDYPADGFSRPYQLFIGLASLFYLLLGLIYLRKLIQKLFEHPLAALCVPIAIFYGTHLYTYAILANSLSHLYSFTFLTLFIYFLVSFFKDADQRLRNFLLCFLCLAITGCIRPLNGLILLVVPAFVPAGFFKKGFRFGKFKFGDGVIIVLTLGVILNQFIITYGQTGSLIAYTYTDEKFFFGESKFFDGLWSYHMGLFVYVPLMFLSLFGLAFLPQCQRIILPLFFFLIIYIYGAWWYWPILKRALIDFYVIPAIFLGALISNAEQLRWKIFTLGLTGLTVLYFQFKYMQMSSGILDELTTYKEMFWRNFFRTDKANLYPVPPSTILKQITFDEGFETSAFAKRSSEKFHTGAYCLDLGPDNYICKIIEQPIPELFDGDGCKKIRFSFWSYFEKGIKSVHVFIKFFDKKGNVIQEIPDYVNEDRIHSGYWDYKEFGYEIVSSEGLTKNTVGKIEFIIWNVDAKQKMYIDDARVEFMLTDRSFETVK